MPLIILVWGGFYFFYGPIINVDGGLGYDGHYYGHYANRFISMVFGDKIDSYRIQRIFPSFMVYLGMNILNIKNSFYNIIKFFQIYNLVLLQISALLWFAIAGHFKLKLKYVWLGFVFWFLNFGVAELSFYYPVLTDATALCLGFFLLYAHLKNKLLLKIVITFCGSFTWAGFLILGIILILFPVSFKPELSEYGTQKQSLKKRFFVFLLPLPFFIEGIYHFRRFLNNERIPYIETDLINQTLYISVFLNFLLMAYFFSFYLPENMSLKDYPSLIRKVFSSLNFKNILICIALFITVTGIQRYLGNEDLPTDNSFSKMFYLMSLYGATKPLVYVFLYINYFGPIFILFFLYMKKFTGVLYELGFGVYLFFIIPFLTIFATESRMNLYFLPFFLLPAILMLSKADITGKICLILTFIAFLFSKIYIPMFNMPDSVPNKLTFHNQILYINFFTISNRSYLFLLIVITVITLLLLYAFKKSGKSISENFSKPF